VRSLGVIELIIATLQMEQMGGMEALMDKMPGMGQIPQSVKNQMMGAVESKKMVAIIIFQTV
jgi:signal recognition particle subunit SRP54